MNNAGLPGTGLGGLFYVVLALAMPVVELCRTLRGRGSAERWRQVATQFALACGILAALVASAALLLHLVDAPNPFGFNGTALLLSPVVLAAVLLVVLVVTLRAWAWIVVPGREETEPGPAEAGRPSRDSASS